jgi:hypothetical protein
MQYGDPGIPESLVAADPVPAGSRLAWSYFLPYYGVLAAGLAILRRFPLGRDTAWTPEHWTTRAFPRSPEGLGDLLTDEEFTRLRVEGPNLFLLRHVPERDAFVCDLAPMFDGLAEAVRAWFVVEGGRLVPHSIEVDGVVHRPGEAG